LYFKFFVRIFALPNKIKAFSQSQGESQSVTFIAFIHYKPGIPGYHLAAQPWRQLMLAVFF